MFTAAFRFASVAANHGFPAAQMDDNQILPDDGEAQQCMGTVGSPISSGP